MWVWNDQVSQEKDIPRAQWFGHMPGFQKNVPTDYRGHGGEIYHFVIHAGGEIRRGQPHMKMDKSPRSRFKGSHAWLNNNPGNITGPNMNLGQYPGKLNWHNFLIFPSREVGREAIRKLLREGHHPKVGRHPAGFYRDLTILGCFEVYAPKEDGNSPETYARDVAAAAGVPQGTLIGALTDDQLTLVQRKIEEIEGWIEGDTIRSLDDPRLPSALRARL